MFNESEASGPLTKGGATWCIKSLEAGVSKPPQPSLPTGLNGFQNQYATKSCSNAFCLDDVCSLQRLRLRLYIGMNECVLLIDALEVSICNLGVHTE